MTVNFDIPKQLPIEKYRRYLKLAGFLALLVMAIKLISSLVEKIHERRQNRKLQKLEQRVDALEDKVAKLEKK